MRSPEETSGDRIALGKGRSAQGRGLAAPLRILALGGLQLLCRICRILLLKNELVAQAA